MRRDRVRCKIPMDGPGSGYTASCWRTSERASGARTDKKLQTNRESGARRSRRTERESQCGDTYLIVRTAVVYRDDFRYSGMRVPSEGLLLKISSMRFLKQVALHRTSRHRGTSIFRYLVSAIIPSGTLNFKWQTDSVANSIWRAVKNKKHSINHDKNHRTFYLINTLIQKILLLLTLTVPSWNLYIESVPDDGSIFDLAFLESSSISRDDDGRGTTPRQWRRLMSRRDGAYMRKLWLKHDDEAFMNAAILR